MIKKDKEEIEALKDLAKNIWSLWESIAECGELSIGPQFSANYKKYEEEIEQRLK